VIHRARDVIHQARDVIHGTLDPIRRALHRIRRALNVIHRVRCDSPGTRSNPPGARSNPPGARSDPPDARSDPIRLRSCALPADRVHCRWNPARGSRDEVGGSRRRALWGRRHCLDESGSSRYVARGRQARPHPRTASTSRFTIGVARDEDGATIDDRRAARGGPPTEVRSKAARRTFSDRQRT
jgi:hypothetical protein